MNDNTSIHTTVGLDISERKINYCELTIDGEVTGEGRFINSAEQLTKRYENSEQLRFVLEVGAHSRWIAELLTSFGHVVLVVDPRKVKLITESLRKTDRNDAATLAYLGVRVPEQLNVVQLRGERHQRVLTLVRARHRLVESRTKLVNAVRGLVKPFGLRVRVRGCNASYAQTVRSQLPEEMVSLLEPLLEAVTQVNVAIKAYDRQVKGLLEKVAPDAVVMTSAYGVAELTALYFWALVGDPHRFANNRNVAPYFGLTRRQKDSGDTESRLGITKHGDPYMRALLANCASHILGPFGKPSAIRDWGLSLCREKSRGGKAKARTAVSRKLAVVMLTLRKTQTPYKPYPDASEQRADDNTMAA